MNFNEMEDKYNDYVIKMRRYFHENPEVSGKEYNTSKVIKEELDKLGIPWIDCGLETGVLATVKGNKPGKTILLRGDMDALSVTEETDAKYQSKNNGVMHACGHDCHIAMMLAAAAILNDNKSKLCGNVKLAFQPAEESAEGAKSMVENGAMEGVDGCFAIHVWSDVESGQIACDAGPRMAAAYQFIIDVKGKGGHGAAPHQCIDAAVVSTAIVNNLQTVVSRETSPVDPAVVTIGVINVGERWNVVPEKAHMEGTIRCFSDYLWKEIPTMVERIVKDTAKALRAEAEIKFFDLVPPTNNNPEMSETAKNAAKKIFGGNAAANVPPTMGGEDFAYFMQEAPGAVALLGVKNEACGAVWAQHSARFCVDEDVLAKGAMLYAQVAMDFNSEK